MGRRLQRIVRAAPANDNERPRRSILAVKLNLPVNFPVQLVEAEVLAELLKMMPEAANDNGEIGT